MERVRICAADIDQTMVPKGKELKPITLQALEEMHTKGVLIGIATGRPLDWRMHERCKEWNMSFDFDFMIGMNGGDLWERWTNTLHHYMLLKKEYMHDIMTFLAPYDVNMIVYDNGYDHVKAYRMDEFMKGSMFRNHSKVEICDINSLCEKDTGKIEVHYREEDEEKIFALIQEHADPAWTATKTYMGTVEFQAVGLHKGVALEKFCQMQNIPLSECIAFGDEANDIGLLKTAGLGVCMKNGADYVKAIADAITEYPVEEDGMGCYLYDHILNSNTEVG